MAAFILQEEVLKGLENKQPKIVAACTSVLRQAIRQVKANMFIEDILLTVL